jgi:hypothetical protein
VVEGKIVDPFGNPISGVKVHVLKSAYASETDSQGSYRVPYAPGTFEIAYRLAGYTTEIVPLHIQVPTQFPSDVVVLYPQPTEGLLIGFQTSNTQQLTAQPVTAKITFKGFRSERTWRCPPRGDTMGKTGKTIQFADTTGRNIRLARLGPGGLIAHDDPSPESARYEGWRDSKAQRIGEEQLLIRSVKPSVAGPHAWVVVDEDGTINPDQATCYPFVVAPDAAVEVPSEP